MYRMVIVDDEKWAVRGLLAAIEGQSWFKLAGEAHDGFAGLELLRKEQPELAFVDVQMPGMNGLQLIERAAELGLSTQCIMVSSHAEFAYVQKAMFYDAVCYCLKPFSRSELLEGMEKAYKRLLAKPAPLRDAARPSAQPAEKQPAATPNRLVNQMLQYIHQNYQQNVSVQDLAALCSIHQSYAGQLFRQEVGETFSSYLSRIRMEKALSLLSGTDMGIAKVAATVGFSDYFYFAKVFKKATGVTPSAYRDGAGESIRRDGRTKGEVQKMHGVTIERGLSDWQILQQSGGVATARFSGIYRVPKAAVSVGVKDAWPIYRVAGEADGFVIIPWTRAEREPDEGGLTGRFAAELRLPAGGPYRIETGLETAAKNPEHSWIFRGDARLHIGVGDVFIIAGQSNASGYAKDSAYDPPDIAVHHFRNRGSWDMACHPLNESTDAADSPSAEMGISGGSPFLSFGRRLKEWTGRPVGLISTALGGQPLSRWDDRVDGSLLSHLLARVEASGCLPAGVLWYQGESDAMSEEAATYFERFSHVVASVRKALGAEIPFFTFQLGRTTIPCDDVGWGLLREAQRKAAREIPGVYVLPTLDAPISDVIHTGAHANLMLGDRLARQCYGALYGGKPHMAPDIARAQASGECVILSFDGVSEALTLPEEDAARAGFTAQDVRGPIEITQMKAEAGGSLRLTLSRAPGEGATVSFAHEKNPTYAPPLDGVTYMPPLSFYKLPIEK